MSLREDDFKIGAPVHTGAMTPQTTPMYPETVALQRARAGDREAFIALAEQHLPALYRFVTRELRYHEALGDLVPGEVDVEDVLDEVVVTALRQLHRMPRHATFKGWLRHLVLHILRRLVQDSLRRRRHERVHLDDPLAVGPGIDESGYPLEVRRTWKDVLPDRSIPLPEEVVELKATWEELEAALNRLSPDQRQIFVLRAMEGLTPPEIAAMLGRPLPEVLAVYRAAREVLRRWFFNGMAASGARAEQQVQHQGE